MHAKLASCLAYRTTCEKTVLSFPSSLRPASASALSSTRETLPFKRTSLSLPPRDTIIALVHVVVGGDTRRRYHGSNRDLLQPRRSDAFEQALPYVAFERRESIEGKGIAKDSIEEYSFRSDDAHPRRPLSRLINAESAKVTLGFSSVSYVYKTYYLPR